ncbi:related to homeoprotein [Cephalotrichum gorgonifer]|uniref:Related to homeoprotein n=1 Tax=Cephalotrichum gorgonifer TaxID=2041049 RepID=A0AAE8MWL1_9PEZI|nr:related to homeoprotein [Cephalotrichum gorgonifer]
MLVSRLSDPEQSHWSYSKFETTYQKPTSSPRMSNHFDTPLSAQPDWQGQYSYLPPSESNIFSQPFESGNDNTDASRPRPALNGTSSGPADLSPKDSNTSPLDQKRTLDPMGIRSAKPPTPTAENAELQHPDQYAHKSSDSAPKEPIASTDSPTLPMPSNSLHTISSAGQAQESHSIPPGNVEQKEDEDDLLDDEDMMGPGGEAADSTGQPQTAAERTAQRRKMKRFRLTHQQTRFLMSEFAKQPHPDAAHRERLSREIPGLSPRQVQVWFQNRRAKIKRLTADDRDRMMKMRAVPDDFDNVGALHSPYGAVHGMATPISSPVDFTTPSYADHMMRGGPLMVDVRRAEGEDHMSPTGLSPAFGNIGFSASGNMSNADILSPLSPTSNDRLDTSSMQMQNRQGVRPLQPLQLREAMSRSRSDNLQSPLRSSMSWKGDSIDYNSYQAQHTSPIGGQNRTVYPQDQLSGASSSMGYDSTYSTATAQSPTGINYPNMQSSNLQQNSQTRNSRLRAASATLPLGLDLRNQYRPVSGGLNSPSHSSTPRVATTSSQYASSAYTASFPSAPLTAPVDFSLSRNGGSMRAGVQDYSMPQMSAPIAPPNDFSQAFQASLSSPTARTPMRDSFGMSHGQGQEQRGGEGYGGDDIGSSSLSRKRSYTGISTGGSAPAVGSAPQHVYGSTT